MLLSSFFWTICHLRIFIVLSRLASPSWNKSVLGPVDLSASFQVGALISSTFRENDYCQGCVSRVSPAGLYFEYMLFLYIYIYIYKMRAIFLLHLPFMPFTFFQLLPLAPYPFPEAQCSSCEPSTASRSIEVSRWVEIDSTRPSRPSFTQAGRETCY